jgi:asparagine synthase (glutamine-hydrolysing)
MIAIMYIPDGKIPCYTFSGTDRISFDARIARKVAAACHQPYEIVHLGKEFLSNFSNYAEKTVYISDGYHDVSRSHELYFNKLAREIAPIRVTGKYGGEVLRNVSTFKPNPPCESLFNPTFNKFIDKAERTFSEISKGNRLSFSVFKEIPWRMHGCLAIEKSQLILRSPYMDNALVNLMYRAPSDVRSTNRISLRLIRDNNPVLFNILTDQGLGGNSNFIFTKMARIFYRISFKAEWCYNEGMPHWLARMGYYTPKIFNPERQIIGHHKIGQSRIWFRDELSHYVKGLLLDKQTSNLPFINKSFIEKMANDHINGIKNYTKEINLMITVALIQKVLISSN